MTGQAGSAPATEASSPSEAAVATTPPAKAVPILMSCCSDSGRIVCIDRRPTTAQRFAGALPRSPAPADTDEVKPTLKVVVCDDEAKVRRLLTRALGVAGGMEVVDAVTSVEALLEVVPTLAPDVIVLDVNLPGSNGIEGIDLLRKAGWTGPVVVMSADNSYESDARAAGASSFFHKGSRPLGHLVESIRGAGASGA